MTPRGPELTQGVVTARPVSARGRRLALAGLTRLPPGVLRRLAGRPIVVDGAALAPEYQLGLRTMPEVDRDRLPVARQRAAIDRDAWITAGRPVEVGAVRDLQLGTIPARLYLPPGAGARHGPLGLLVYLHGGGWVVGSIDSHDGVTRFLCRHAGVAVLSVGYRLAPEHPFPAGLDDAREAVVWAAEHAAELGVDRIAVGGDSAGANLAAVVCRQLRGTAHAPAAQLLLVPAVDLSRRGESYRLFGSGFSLSAKDVDWFTARYLPDPALVGDPRVSPLLADDLSGLPPAHVVVAGFDVLRDEGLAYAARLRAAGVPVTQQLLDGAIHPWANVLLVRSSRAALLRVADWLGDEIGSAAPDPGRTQGAGGTAPSLPGATRTATLARMPALAAQVRRTRRNTPRLPEAAGRTGLVGGTAAAPGDQGSIVAQQVPRQVVLVGDSVAAGVGLAHHADSIAGVLAELLHERTGAPVRWQVIARSGADAAGVAALLEDPDARSALAGADVVAVSVGVNDVKGLSTDRHWRAGVTAILDRIRAASPEVPVVVLALPPMERFPALPPRLAATLGRRAVRLDAVARDVVRAYPKVTVLDLDDATLTADDFAPDGFHPGAALHTMIAHRMAGLTTGPGCP